MTTQSHLYALGDLLQVVDEPCVSVPRRILAGALEAIEAGGMAAAVMNLEGVKEELRALLAQETAASRATDEAEFELHVNGDYEASATGPRADAWREIQNYAAQYSQDGPVEIYEIKRVLVTKP